MSDNTAPHDAPLLSRRHEIRLCPGCSIAVHPSQAVCRDCSLRLPQHLAARVQRMHTWNRQRAGHDKYIRNQAQQSMTQALAILKPQAAKATNGDDN